MKTVVSEEMRGALGTEIARRVSYPVSASDIRRWVLATYWPEDPPARFLARDEAGLIAPEDHNPFAWAVAEQALHASASASEGNDADKTEKQIGIAGPGLRNQLNGGVSVRYGAAMAVGDVITSVRTLTGYSEREGKLGHMLFTTTTDTWTNQYGDFVKSTEMTLIRY